MDNLRLLNFDSSLTGQIINELWKIGGIVYFPKSPKEIHVLPIDKYYIYAILNKEDLITIGISEHGGSRLKKEMRGHTNARHIKAFISVMTEACSSSNNEIYYTIVSAQSAEAAKLVALQYEAVLHEQFTSLNIAGIDCSSIKTAQLGLFNKYKTTEAYMRLNGLYKQQFDEWFYKLIDNDNLYFLSDMGDRTLQNQGDTMEVYVLWHSGKKYLIPMIETVTNNYYIYKDKTTVYKQLKYLSGHVQGI